jgi:hypothetical protein
VNSALEPSLRETKENNMINKIDNVGVKGVKTMLEELVLEAFLIGCDASSHKYYNIPNVVKGEKMA